MLVEFSMLNDILIHSFLRSGIEAKRVDEFRHLTMPPEFSKKWKAENINTRLPLPILPCGMQLEAKKNITYSFYTFFYILFDIYIDIFFP